MKGKKASSTSKVKPEAPAKTEAAASPKTSAPAPSKAKEPSKAPKKLKVCRFFEQGNCKKGAACQFLHEAVAAAPVSSSDKDSDSSIASSSSGEALSYACPFCKGSFSELELIQHLPDHQGENANQTCPICAAQPGGDPNYKSQDLFGHFALRHGGARLGRGGGAGRGKPASPGSASFAFGGLSVGDEQQQPPKVMKTCHAVDRSIRGMQQSRGVDFIWEYAWMVDSGSEVRKLQTPCAACQGTLALSEPRAMLPCGCSFHTGCIAIPPTPCPVCKKP